MKLKQILEGKHSVSGGSFNDAPPNAEEDPFYGKFSQAIIRSRRKRWSKRRNKKIVEK